MELKLILEVEKRPILWNVRSDIYKRSDLKAGVWEEIAQILGPMFSGEAVSTRFKNMKDTYFSNNRKVTASKAKCSGAAAGHVYKPKWPLFVKLQFLDKAGEKCESVSNVPSQHVQASSSNVANSAQMTPLQKDMLNTRPQEVTYFDKSLNHYVTMTLNDSDGVSQEEEVNQSESKASVEMTLPHGEVLADSTQDNNESGGKTAIFEKRGSKKRQANKVVMVEAVQVLKDLCKPVPNDPHPDSADTFASFVASRLRGLSGDQRKLSEDAILKVLVSF